MRAILMSIKHKWCEKIFSGEKTVEVRKSAPKEVPFKAYIYETKAGFIEAVRGTCPICAFSRGKVVGEFVCDTVEENIPDYNPAYERFFYNSFECGSDCLTSDEIVAYGKGDPLHGWHITKVKLFDEPRELAEFGRYVRKQSIIHKGIETIIEDYKEFVPLTRPPQSWRYVEEIEE